MSGARPARRLLAAAALLLAGCATPPPATPSGGAQAACASALHLDGRMSLHDADHQLYGGFVLRLGTAGDGRLDLLSPLGQELARADWTADGASLDDGHGVRTFDSFEAMSERLLGLELPRAALQDWVRGRPAASLPSRPVDGGFEQLGWTVRPGFEDGRLHLLRASRGDAALSLVVDHVEDCAGGGA